MSNAGPVLTWRRGDAAAAAAAALALLLAFVQLDATHLQTVADAHWVVPLLGVPVPWVCFSVLLPVALAGGALWWPQNMASVGPLRVGAALLVLVALVLVWALHLARHDRLLTGLQGALVVVGCVTCVRATPRWRRARWRWLAPLGVIAPIAVLSYGAVWGEARCGRPQELPCLRDGGVRVWVPTLFDALGVAVFADLRGADLRNVVLAGRDLRLADLREARLTGADLTGARLRRARLDGIDAEGSIWRGAVMDGASMSRATLRGADLRGVHAYLVDLSDADLRGADIRGGSLSHALLPGARMEGAALGGAYLRFSRGWTAGQLAQAVADDQTRLPDGARGP